MSLSRIEIITSTNKLELLMDALNKFGISGMTVSNVLGCGSQKGTYEYEVHKIPTIRLLPKQLVTLFVDNSILDPLVELIEKELYTGHIGDGRIFISDVTSTVRIRTGEKISKNV